MGTEAYKYYVSKRGDDTYDLRQERFRGIKHPHDVMATGFSAQGMRDLIAQYFRGNCDMSALPPAETTTTGETA